MKEKRKSIDFINSICASRSQGLLGEQRLIRMAEAESLASAFDVLRESAFGGEINYSSAEYERVIESEEKALNAFVKEYAPSDEIEGYCLAPYDFYNAEVMVKCEKLGLSYEEYVGPIGAFSLEELQLLVKGKEQAIFPKELVRAVKEALLILEENGGGMAVGVIFVRAKYEYLTRIVKTGYLKEIISKEIDGLNLCSAIRANDVDLAISQYVHGGKLTVEAIKAIALRDKKALKLLLSSDCWIKDIALQAIDIANSGKPLVETERQLNGLSASRMLAGRYTESGGTYPFMLYYCRRKNEIACVRTALTGKANGLLAEEIKRRFITV